jgi:p-hydroxybenzoate 3-monooxygenase
MSGSPGSQSTAVVILGAGPAGLTLGNLLRRKGVDCVILDSRSRAYVEGRQRGGVLEHSAACLLEEEGLGERLFGGVSFDSVLELRIEGERRLLPYAELSGARVRLCTQQTLVNRLIAGYLDAGGDLRFEAADVTLHDLTGQTPTVTYRGGTLPCRYVAGCDGDHGVSRASIPPAELTSTVLRQDIAWLTILTQTPPPEYQLMAASPHGYAAHFFRGPQASRFYLQCAPGDTVDDWPDERVWRQLALRLADPALPTGPIVEHTIVALRAAVHEPVSYGRLHLAGDAAHIIPPLAGKGMNLAVHDAVGLARALSAAIHDDNQDPLRRYPAECLARTWNYQEHVQSLMEMLHAHSTVDGFRQRLARARLDRLTTSPSAAQALAAFVAGVR